MPKRRAYRAKRKPRRNPRDQSLTAYAISAIKGYALNALKKKLGLNTEMKFVDTPGTTTATGTLVSRIASPTIAQGLTVNTRQGANVRIDKVDLRVDINAAVGATNGCSVRIITARSRWNDGAIVVADILQTTTDFTSPIHNLCEQHGITILADDIVRVGTATSDNASVSYKRTFNRSNMQMTWTDSDTTGVPSNLVRGAIQTFWMLDNVTTSPTFTSTSRCWFVDN